MRQAEFLDIANKQAYLAGNYRLPEDVKELLGLFKVEQEVVTHYLDQELKEYLRLHVDQEKNLDDDNEIFADLQLNDSNDLGLEETDQRPSCQALVETYCLVYLNNQGFISTQYLTVDTSYDSLA